MDMINTGRGALDREAIRDLSNELRALLDRSGSNGRRMTLNEIKRAMARQSDVAIQSYDLKEVLKQLEDDGYLQYSEKAQSVL
eukprot:CAMPEP_0171456402 /NCGR_PEP_ID=MMETSP0945-20130129/2899_1 /TAXON_ID=109269 /ORGANISM="Vaucheria litorea, Strain CCMP2940" /LENGTH=82 /DNA_ID=CAMNT_0011981811 /DNA_START=221 /DNA_END=465 /DNA_ORIENTATION=+